MSWGKRVAGIGIAEGVEAPQQPYLTLIAGYPIIGSIVNEALP